MSQWAMIANYASALEAEIAAEQLRSAGLPAQVRGNDFVGVFGPGFQGRTPRGVDLLVPDSAIARARDILGIELAEDDDAAGRDEDDERDEHNGDDEEFEEY